jgi:putative Mg2+ transporter-C (MgtC) family protein
VLVPGRVVLDPSRLAAQIVSGIGFIGGGLIFVRRDVVRGLTTAAVVWVTAAVGCACAAGLPLLAVFVTVAHFLVVYGYPPLIRVITGSRPATATILVTYRDGHGLLRDILALITRAGYAVERVATERVITSYEEGPPPPVRAVDLRMRLRGPRSTDGLLSTLSEHDGVLSVDIGDLDESGE